MLLVDHVSLVNQTRGRRRSTFRACFDSFFVFSLGRMDFEHNQGHTEWFTHKLHITRPNICAENGPRLYDLRRLLVPGWGKCGWYRIER